LGSQIHETSEEDVRLIVGTRLIVRSKTDWRFASIARVEEEIAVLNVCSPTGRTYRLRRNKSDLAILSEVVPVIATKAKDNWQENLGCYDIRW
jgi:hypothetical protein